MQFSTPHLIAAGVILLIGLAWQFKGKIYNTLKGIGTSSDSETDTDMLDLKGVKRLQARADRLQCPEMQTAMQTVMAHFFHTPGHQ